MNLPENYLIWLIFGLFGGMWTLTIVGILCYCQGRKVGIIEKEGNNSKSIFSFLQNKTLPDLDPVVPTSREEGRIR